MYLKNKYNIDLNTINLSVYLCKNTQLMDVLTQNGFNAYPQMLTHIIDDYGLLPDVKINLLEYYFNLGLKLNNEVLHHMFNHHADKIADYLLNYTDINNLFVVYLEHLRDECCIEYDDCIYPDVIYWFKYFHNRNIDIVSGILSAKNIL